jgi:hypothetical protein
MTEAEQIMKRCQAGTRNYEEANNLHAACYGMIGKLLAQTKQWQDQTIVEIHEAVLEEREACAQVAFSWNFEITDKVAEEIRARGEQE